MELAVHEVCTEVLWPHPHRPGVELKISFLRAQWIGGEWHLKDHDQIAWVAPERLDCFELLPADAQAIPAIFPAVSKDKVQSPCIHQD